MQINQGIQAPKDQYRYIDPTIQAIKKLKIKPSPQYSLADLTRTYKTENDISRAIKFSAPLIFPYSVKDTSQKLVKENIEFLEMLVLDIDGGCTVDTFIESHHNFAYYLYTTVTHRVTGIDKFRVIIPLKEPMRIEDAIDRKQALIEYFSHNDKSYLDESFLAKGRGFVIPIELEFFREYEFKSDQYFELSELPKSDFIPISRYNLTVNGINSQDGIPEIESLANLYANSAENDRIEVNGIEYQRNDAFFRIHVEIAKYRPTEEYQKQLANNMNWDGSRNTTDRTVEEARKYCNSINLSALNARSEEYSKQVVTQQVDYLKVSDFEIHEGKKHLLTATTGTGKTTFFLGRGCDHKVIFAVPINSIGEQLKLEHNYPFETGTNVNPLKEDKVICSYNYLVELLRLGVPSDYVIVLDEFHRVISDDFRTGKLSELVDLVAASSNTIFCVSGTFDPSHFNIFEFDFHYDFKAKRDVRNIQVWETNSGLDNALIQFLKNLDSDTNNLVLFDDKSLLASIKKVLTEVEIVTSNEKEFINELVNPKVLKGQVKGTILTTQVLMEGINLFGLDNIVIVAKKHYGREQIVQFFERDRDLSATCHLIRKPIKDCDIYIPDSDKEKEYQNQIFTEVVDRIGLEGMKLIGVKDTDMLLRTTSNELYINCLYAPIKQKQAMDRANFKNLNLSQYGYELLDVKTLNSKPSLALQDIKRLKVESEKDDYSIAVDSILAGEKEAPDFPDLMRLIEQLKKHNIKNIRKICLDKNEFQAYTERFRYIDSKLEKAIYLKFQIDNFYSSKECNNFLSEYVGQKSFARVTKNNYRKVFKRYFHLKECRKTNKREAGIRIIGTRHVEVIETSSDLNQ
ncbi:MAG: hypothetical protein ABJV04_00560 [Aliiglaciecola sp.]|uniref:hypothetical protein n=1 Tax=Aliiglaciecola sp. TaxID=1872441 RepID=UPI003298FCD8